MSATPHGLAFMVIASTTERGIRYKVGATIGIGDSEPVSIGGATSADTRHSMTQFWHRFAPEPVIEGREVTISIYEYTADVSVDRSLIQTFALSM